MCISSTREGSMARLTGAIAAKNGDQANATRATAYADRLEGTGSSPRMRAPGTATTTLAKRPGTVLGGSTTGKTLLGA